MDELLDLFHSTIPWVCKQATELGLRRRDNRLGKLGGELFILDQELRSCTNENIYPKLTTISELVTLACFGETKRSSSLDALRQFAVLDRPNNTSTSDPLVSVTHRSLVRFVSDVSKYSILLRLISDVLADINVDETAADEHWHGRLSHEPNCPTHVSNALYTQLETYSVCACNDEHLKRTHVRLDPEHDLQEGSDMIFDFLFIASSSISRQTPSSVDIRWKEAKISVSRNQVSKKRRSVTLNLGDTRHSRDIHRQHALSKCLRTVQRGEFCKLIRGRGNGPVWFHVRDGNMSVENRVHNTKSRIMLPVEGTPLKQWLQDDNRIPKRMKVVLAYTVARSVWQYYNSYWMTSPWTHENLHFLQEQDIVTDSIKPRIFFVTKLVTPGIQMQDFLTDDDLCHVYPNILALGVVLIEIATGNPFETDSVQYSWDGKTLNDYYDWACAKASGGQLRNLIHPIYEDVVNTCLDEELFRDGPLDVSNHSETIEVRRSHLYEQVVQPLEKLYKAYHRDNWDAAIDPLHVEPLKVPNVPETVIQSTDDTKPTVAVFCALHREADAVAALFDEVRTRKTYAKQEGDDNAYTLGRIGRHNLLLVHMGGLGKGIASHAASCARTSYPDIKLALVVGICGGLPFGENNAEVILGDVVISNGIVQYDLGRQNHDSFNARAGHEVHRQPPPQLRSLLSKLRTARPRENLQSSTSRNLRKLLEQSELSNASYPGSAQDELFPAEYPHKSRMASHCLQLEADTATHRNGQISIPDTDLSCNQLSCDKQRLLSRKRLQIATQSNGPPQPRVHIGPVGSGDTVMKSGQHRDEIARKHDLVAFEMEAAGVCDIFPSLVIKGVCDYADSHKNKVWQDYAACTAAACMKAFLDEWSA
ncbi:uncharacterized protein BDV14DRAFT_199255 [Aspergillus stella-maris]|uniref:uncharacterized protein n=1 Tax=Aspergillus stella-maris TaxID=1810926 RepID=UPI003CCC9006